MVGYILQKAGYALLTIFGVVTVIFFLFTILPGDPARMMLDQNEDPEQLAIIKKKYGFDKPVGTQYLYYLNDLSPVSIHKKKAGHYTSLATEKYAYVKLIPLSGWALVLKTPYLRESFQKSGKAVTEVISDTLPNTMVLAVSAIFIAIVLGIFLGIISANYRDTALDRAIQVSL